MKTIKIATGRRGAKRFMAWEFGFKKSFSNSFSELCAREAAICYACRMFGLNSKTGEWPFEMSIIHLGEGIYEATHLPFKKEAK